MTSNQQVHELKCAREFFDAVESGEKPFEIRVDDRPFKIDDTLYLREVDLLLHYTGRATRKRVTFILRGWGIKHGHVGLGLTSMRPVETFARQPGDCKHERASVKCPDCGIDFVGEMTQMPTAYKPNCEGGTGGPCTQLDCEVCWDDDGIAVSKK
jgi:hypothetical protein